MADKSADDLLQVPAGDKPMPEIEKEAMLSYSALFDALEKFFTVVIHTIAYERGLYPKYIFRRKNAFSFPVQECQDDNVCQWIKSVLDLTMVELRKVHLTICYLQLFSFILNCGLMLVYQGAICSLWVTILSPDNEALERVVFDLSELPAVPPEEHDEIIIGTDNDEYLEPVKPRLADLEAHFRKIFRTMSTYSAGMSKLPAECTLGVLVTLKGGTPTDFEEGWVPAEHLFPLPKKRKHGTQTQQLPEIQNIHIVNTNGLKMSVWAQEARGKAEYVSPKSLESTKGKEKKRKHAD